MCRWLGNKLYITGIDLNTKYAEKNLFGVSIKALPWIFFFSNLALLLFFVGQQIRVLCWWSGRLDFD